VSAGKSRATARWSALGLSASDVELARERATQSGQRSALAQHRSGDWQRDMIAIARIAS
jgi:hypothetical protein